MIWDIVLVFFITIIIILGGYFLAYGATLQPIFNAAGAYSSTGTDEVKGEISPGFQASFGEYTLICRILYTVPFSFFPSYNLSLGLYWLTDWHGTNPIFMCFIFFFLTKGFFLLAMMILNLIFLICSIRTNICLFIIFLAAVTGFGLITGSCWNLALSNSERALILQKVQYNFLYFFFFFFLPCISH